MVHVDYERPDDPGVDIRFLLVVGFFGVDG